jgi:hypothetical protein
MRHPAAYKPEFGRVVLLQNHTAESQRQAAQCEDELLASKLGLPVTTLTTLPGGQQPNAKLLCNKLEEGDLVAGIFGDGTIRDVLLALRNRPFISLRGGNARDFGSATHRNPNAAPSELIQKSVAIGAKALSWTVRNGGLVIAREQAISYIGHGETALGSVRMASDEYRDRPKGMHRDWDLGLASINSTLRFQATDNQGKEWDVSDLSFSKGRRMAKLGRIPVDYWDPHFHLTPFGTSKTAKWLTAGGLFIGHPPGEAYDTYGFTVHQDIPVHFDGDPPVQIPAESHIQIGLGQEYTLMTTRLKAPH